MQKLCCRQKAPPFFPTAVLLPSQHKFHQHIRTERSRCHAFPKATRNPARLVASGQAQRVALPGRSSRRPHQQDSVELACQKAHQRCGIAKPVTPHSLRHYLPFRTMSGTGTPAQYFRQMREVAHDIVLTPSISPMQGKGVHREVYYRLPSSSFASAGRSSRVTYRVVCEVTE